MQIRLEVAEPNEPVRLIARRTVGSRAPNHEGLSEAFDLASGNVSEFVNWLNNWLAGDGTHRWFQLGREVDSIAGTKLNPRKRIRLERPGGRRRR